ncbi:MAG TPA: SOS response-associated peptidase [Chloroflexota bacterium]|nr:SOS response-associated peptidase [Chloroflexota bacterium]
MCGRYTLTSPEDIAGRFGLGALTETHIEPRFNVAPSQGVPVIVGRESGPDLTTMRWGFQPAWMRTDGQRPPPINARSESLLDRPMFRGAVAHGRCLIPADGFYEWMAIPGSKTKQPMYIRLKGGELFAFAGLYVQGPNDVGETCVIVTTAANDALAPIHERMPVILERDAEMRWLDPDLEDGQAALSYLQPVAPERFESYPVSSLVSSYRNQGPELIAPVEGAPAGAPRLF